MTLLPGDVILTEAPRKGSARSASATRSPSASKASALSPTRLSSVASASAPAVRVRFCPSPTGNPHVGLVRTALFSWAFARHNQGTLVFRIEGHRRGPRQRGSRTSSCSTRCAGWLRLGRGPGGGRTARPQYRQSQRMDIYQDVAQKLVDGGYAYPLLLLDRGAGRPPRRGPRRRQAVRLRRPLPRADRRAEAGLHEAEGRKPITRFRMPDETITFTDLVRGDITYEPENVPDYGIVRANGAPLSHARQPGRRRPDGDHPRPARRGPCSPPRPPPDRPVQGADGPGHRQVHARVRPPPVRHGRGQQEAQQARPAVVAELSTASAASSRGPAQLPVAARLVPLGRPRHLLDRGDGGGLRRQGRPAQPGPLRPQEVRVDQRRPHPPARPEGLRRALRPRGSSPLRAVGLPRTSDEAKWAAIAARADPPEGPVEITDNVDFLFLPEPVFDEPSWTKAR